MSRLAAVCLLCLAVSMPGDAIANGRFPASVNVHTKPESDQIVLLPVTFGLLYSTDGGASFRWMCEDSIGYGGMYDPDYAVATDGSIFATTFDGLKVTSNQGCNWNTVGGPLTDAWVGEVEIGPDGKVWAATSSGGMPNDVFVSDDDGATFTSSNLYHDSAWWKSLRVAPSNANRIYVSGYLVAETPQALLRRSNDGGATWDTLSVGDFTFGSQPQLFIEGVSPTDPDIVFARVLGAMSPAGDAIYRSEDGGASWTKVLEMGDTIRAFLVGSDGTTVIAGTVGPCIGDPSDAAKGCVRISTNGGVDWSPATQEPKMACITERGDGAIFACGANWEPDNFALGRSTDGQTWTKVFRFVEMAGPVSCDPGTVQYDVCESLQWPSIAEQFGVGGAGDGGPSAIDAGNSAAIDGGSGGNGGGGGCGCSIGLAAGVFVAPFGRRRRR